jgi:hypothetical protein
MYAWRRSNVEALNDLARRHRATSGHLHGPELVAPGGRRYAAGDRIVSLAPGGDGRLVTSERGVVTHVDPQAGTLTARMDDGRAHHFTSEQTGVDRLAHGYAVTVHRSQGATVRRAHRFEDGGGRELAYVAMSRARERSTAYVIADDLDQAIEDLQREWSVERRPRWAIDTGTPISDPTLFERDGTVPSPLQATLRRARLRAERDAVVAAVPADPSAAIASVSAQLARLRRERADLEVVLGRHFPGPQGQAARDLQDAIRRRREAERTAAMPAASWRARRWWRKEVAVRKAIEVDARQQWEQVAAPAGDRVDHAIQRVQDHLDELQDHRRTRRNACPTTPTWSVALRRSTDSSTSSKSVVALPPVVRTPRSVTGQRRRPLIAGWSCEPERPLSGLVLLAAPMQNAGSVCMSATAMEGLLRRQVRPLAGTCVEWPSRQRTLVACRRA